MLIFVVVVPWHERTHIIELLKKSMIFFIFISISFASLRRITFLKSTFAVGLVRMYILLDNIYIRFGTKLYRQIVGIPLGTNCAHFVADLFLFCYERDFMKYLSSDNQADVIKAFNSTSRYLDDLLH